MVEVESTLGFHSFYGRHTARMSVRYVITTIERELAITSL